MSYPDTHEGRVRFLQDQLAWATARKLTPASKRSRDPATAIDALASIRDGKGNKVNMTFKLATVQMDWFEGQELTYKTRCPECRKRKITVNTAYSRRNAVWPPEDGYPDKCEACQGGAA